MIRAAYGHTKGAAVRDLRDLCDLCDLCDLTPDLSVSKGPLPDKKAGNPVVGDRAPLKVGTVGKG